MQLSGQSKAPYRRAIFPCQFFLDKFYLLVCTAKNWQVFLDKEPGWKAGHTSFSTRKLVRVYGRQGKIVRRTHEKINLSRKLSRKNDGQHAAYISVYLSILWHTVSIWNWWWRKWINGRFPLLRILNTTTSMLFGRVMELSTKYPQSIMVVVFSKGNKGNRLFRANF